MENQLPDTQVRDETKLAELGYRQDLNRDWSMLHNFAMFVALGMAEIVSAIPTSGGPYFWAAILAPPNVSAFASWVTGWYVQLSVFLQRSPSLTGCNRFNLLGQVAVTTGITFGMANLLSVTATVGTSYEATAGRTLGIYAALLVSHGVINSFGVHILRYLNNTSILLHSVGISCFCIAVLAKAPTHQSAKLLFSIQDFDRTVTSDIGQPVIQILVDIFGNAGAIALMTLVLVCIYHCGLFSMTSNSRMMFGFSRDGGLPKFFNHVDVKFRAPIRTIWLAAFLSFLLAIPSLGSSVAFSAATSIATIGLYISYGLPILVGLIWPSNFKKGPFNLRLASRWIALVAVLWIGFISIVFCLPTQNPVDSQTLNYTPVAVGIVALWSFGSWFLWARRWFTGPIRQIEAERMGIDLEEPGALEKAEAEGKFGSHVNDDKSQ
ncbi:MAG: hypothetical protein Q9203_002117 [Teloschistes exilis]